MDRKDEARSQVVNCINWDWAVIALCVLLLALLLAGQTLVANSREAAVQVEDTNTVLVADAAEGPVPTWDAVAVNWDSEKRRWP